jgi:hypothetical protein
LILKDGGFNFFKQRIFLNIYTDTQLKKKKEEEESKRHWVKE